MNRRANKFIQTLIVLIGLGTVALMLWFPTIEGRNAHATLFEVYFNDPFLAYAYMASISFYMVLYQAFMLLKFLERDREISERSVKALRTIKQCGFAMIVFVVGGVIWILLSESDDRPGGFALALMIALPSLIVATTAAKYERRWAKHLPG